MATQERDFKIIHWLGAGLSSAPGIRALIQEGHPVIVWNRTVQKAEDVIALTKSKTAWARPFHLEHLKAELQAGDIVVSMLPAIMHPDIAKICLKKCAHLVTTSYISDEMQALDEQAASLQLCFINEAGLDPGLDHLLARELAHLFKHSSHCQPDVKLAFKSLCGGFPEHPGEFCYKFSWSPLGVLRALKNTARFIDNGKIKTTKKPWKHIFQFEFNNELFETYPNRDSLPYIEEYGLKDVAQIETFIRGTIRPSGWVSAWDPVFKKLEKTNELEELSKNLWEKYRYSKTERDRVLLYVELSAFRESHCVWSKALAIHQFGKGKETAMARTVSLPASFAVGYILSGRAPLGVSGAPNDRLEASRWLRLLKKHDIAVLDDEFEPYYFDTSTTWGFREQSL